MLLSTFCKKCGFEVPIDCVACPNCFTAMPIQPQFTSPTSKLNVQEPRISVRRMAAYFSVCLYLTIAAILFMPESAGISTKAFGARPLGLNPQVFALVLFTLLSLPYPIRVFPGAARVMLQMVKDGEVRGRLGILIYIWNLTTTHPELAISRFWVFFGMIYFFTLAMIWTFYAAYNGF
jgi:hypothetical protein